MSRRYRDRGDAGRVLAEHLQHLAGRDVVVLALPRGGVPVAAPVARTLGAPLDVLVVRKLGLPGQPELAMAAIAGVGDTVQLVRNERVVAAGGVGEAAFTAAYDVELLELHRRERAYRGRRPRVTVTGQVVVLVDDGLATGTTMRAAVAAVRQQQPARVVVAVPFGSPRTCAALRGDADELVCAWSPTGLHSVGEAYVDFAQTGDEEVRRLLAGEEGEAGGPGLPR